MSRKRSEQLVEDKILMSICDKDKVVFPSFFEEVHPTILPIVSGLTKSGDKGMPRRVVLQK